MARELLNVGGMEQLLSRTLIVSAISLGLGAFALGACTHTTDRVVEPVGGGDASTTVPETSDASVAPIGPVAGSHGEPAHEPPLDFSLVRSPELGASLRSEVRSADDVSGVLPSMGGGAGGNGAGGGGGSDRRPVSTGGT